MEDRKEKYMKRVLALLVTMTMVGSMLMGCGSSAAGDSQQAEGERNSFDR